jgi:hypothetical protein
MQLVALLWYTIYIKRGQLLYIYYFGVCLNMRVE